MAAKPTKMKPILGWMGVSCWAAELNRTACGKKKSLGFARDFLLKLILCNNVLSLIASLFCKIHLPGQRNGINYCHHPE